MSVARAVIISLAISTLLCLWLDQPSPAKISEVPYCVVTFKAAARDEIGQWHIGWAKGYAPCSQQDEYRNI